MVLTNFEFWAADASSSLPSSASTLEFENSSHHHHGRNPFDPRVVPHLPSRNMTHLSSNGYYGFSYINAAHDIEFSNNNNNNNIDITNNNFMANDVNGMNITSTPTESHHQQHHHEAAAAYANFIGPNNTIGKSLLNTNDANAAASRCKKRFFVANVDDDADGNGAAYCTNASAKRCRFDDDFAAQYCNGK